MKIANPYQGWQPLFGAEGLERNVYQPVGELFTLAQTKSGFLTIGVPEAIRRDICKSVGFQCDVRFHVSTAEIAGIVEAVRNNVLAWTLKLEAAGIHGHGLTFTPEETKAAQSVTVTNNYHAPVASIAQGSNTIGSVSQTNALATPQEIAEAVSALLQILSNVATLSPESTGAVSDLHKAEPELREGRVPFARITKAFEVLSKAQDIAMRAPEVIEGIHRLAQMLGMAG